MSVPKGWTPPRRDVPCTGGCGATVSRTSHFKTAVCQACEAKRRRAVRATTLRRFHEQARRYRILLAVGPYKTYEALLAAIRCRNPHTREHHFDLTSERRA